MDGALIGRRGERQADGLAAGCESLVLLGDYAGITFTRTGDEGSVWFKHNVEVQKD